MQKTRIIILLIYITIFYTGLTVHGQLIIPAQPLLYDHPLTSRQAIDLEVDIQLLSDMWQSQSLPLQAGYTIAANLGPQNAGEWIKHPDEEWQIWQFVIRTNHYTGIALYFDTFELSKQARLFVYTDHKTNYVGAFTNKSAGNKTHFAIQPVYGQEFILELEIPINDTNFQLNISEIGFVHPSIFSERGFGDSGDCNVNVNCEEGQNWQQQKNGITRILVKQGSQLYYCSGSLVNNTRYDGTPYLLTANHCGPNASIADYNQWVFDFQYESPDCDNPLLEPFRLSLIGSQLVARTASGAIESTSDFKLLLLNQDVPDNYKPFYNGWNRQNSITENGVGIHHPQGDIKKISTFLNQPSSTGYGQSLSNPDQRYWRVVWGETSTNHSVTEGGSSGSPLFDSNRRIVGTLSGGGASCTNQFAPDYYGKFSYSWSSNGASASQQLQPWLDPDNTGVEFINGIGIDPDLIFAYFEADANEINLNQSIKFEQQSTGRIESYEWYFEGGTPTSSSAENPPDIIYDSFGTFDVQLIITNESKTDTLLQKDYIKVRPFLYPNPTKGQFTLNFGKETPDEVELQIYDLAGRPVPFNSMQQGNKFEVNLATTISGFYIVDVRHDFYRQTLKLVLIH